MEYNSKSFADHASTCQRISSQRGQTVIFVVVGLSMVFLAVLGFAVDFGNLWFHRQSAQTAADAACTAAAMDMLTNAQGSSNGGFTSGTDFDCTSLPTSAPCQYAQFNGYSGSGLVSDTDSNNISFAFTNTLAGIPQCTTPPNPTVKICIPPAAVLAKPIVQVNVTDRIRSYFFALVSSSRTIDVPAKASCGVVLSTSPIPLLVLDPTREGTLSVNGNINISIVGGPGRSIQVNSINTAAISVKGSSGTIDLSAAGPDGNGADFGVFGINPQPGILKTGTSGGYTSPSPRVNDPFALVNAPAKPTFNGTKTTGVPHLTHGCPDSGGCEEYTPGYYPSGITVSGTAIFQPGIYYLDGSLTAGPNTILRPSTETGDGSGGTVFYFNTANSLDVTANSGKKAPATAFTTLTGTGAYPFGVKCTSTSVTPSNLSASISGSVLLAPCRGPDAATGLCAPNCGINGGNGFGDQLGSFDPGGIQRGILFFQNRAVAANPSWQGGGQFLLSGSMYFHQCVTSGSDTGQGCTNSAFTTKMSLGGNPGSGTYVLGNIVVDQLDMSGTPDIIMDLNPNAAYWIYKASLLQ